VNVLAEIHSYLSVLSGLPNSYEEEEDWKPPKVRNKSDDIETSSESVDKEDAIPIAMAASSRK